MLSGSTDATFSSFDGSSCCEEQLTNLSMEEVLVFFFWIASTPLIQPR